MEFDLSTNDDLAAFLQDCQPVPRSHFEIRAQQARQDLKRKRPARYKKRCGCGACQSCKENARWDRIFNEKFADPFYYDERGPSINSPLSSL
jgi:hypothetical protein